MDVSRRQFLVGCSGAIAAMAGGRVGNLIFGESASAAGARDEILVVVFLRGGCDGLSLVAPFDDPVYAEARGSVALPGAGANAALQITPRNTTVRSSMGLHPKAGPLKELYDARKLAIVHACGLNDDTRSHFEAMDYMERGTPGNRNTPSGWLTRHLQSANVQSSLSTLAAGHQKPAALLGDQRATVMTDHDNFALQTNWRYSKTSLPYNMYASASKMYGGSSVVESAGRRTLEVIDTLRSHQLDYHPEAGVAYPDGGFGESLQLVAQTVKLDLGLRVATVDFGGWDTHEHQGEQGGGYFASLVDNLARGLHAFYDDLATYSNRLTVVVMSEFGRRLGVNSSGGTDHGHGNVMLVLGGNVNGGRIYGQWPGLEDLDQSQDLRITTDYRTVLSEILIRRLGNPHLGTVFPSYSSYSPLGIVAGPDIPAIYNQVKHTVYVPLVRR